MLSGIPAPLDSDQPTAYPAEYAEYRKRYQGYDYMDDKKGPLQEKDQPNLEEYKTEIFELNAEAMDVVAELAEQEQPELVFAVLPLIDDLLHALDEKENWGDIQEAYQTLDEWTAELVDRIDPDHVLLLSDHGMMPVEQSLNPNTYPGLRMDHDPMNGIWASDYDFGLAQQVDVTPAILDYFGYDFAPEKLDITIQENRSSEQLDEISV
jgi:predicted AlkP superfamily pyrophosphatase or phosphodiesterase